MKPLPSAVMDTFDIHQYTNNATTPMDEEDAARLAAGFLLAYTLLGIGGFVAAFWSQRSQLRSFRGCTSTSRCTTFCNSNQLQGLENVHHGLVSLLIYDIINTAVAIFLAVQFLAFDLASTSVVVLNVWYLLRYMGLVMHLMVALSCLHFLCHQHNGAQMRIIYTALVVLSAVVVILHVFVHLISLVAMVTLLFGLALLIMVKCIRSPFPPSSMALKNQVVATSVATFGIVFLPSFVAQCVYSAIPGYSSALMFFSVLFGTNIHIFLDALLWFFILRFPGEEQQQ